jgi:serine/threonine protein kinase
VIKRVMAEGGMATVYEAVHAKLGHRVAIKLLARHLLSKPDVVERFEREARAAARLESTHVVRVIDVDVAEDGRPYIVMEYLEGRDLETELRARGQLPIGDAVAYVLEAAAAVSVAHKAGVVHRDLKPANIFLAQEGARRVVKVLDFGISKVSSPNEVSATSTQTMLGTPLYMSPEQVRSARDVDGRADIWSLGVVLYETITGQLPFLREDASGVIAAIVSDPITPIAQLRPEIPPPLAAAIMKSLEKDRNARFRFIEEFAAALMPFAPGWFRPPKMVTVPPFAPGLPPHLAHSLSDGIDSDRTVADPNFAPDALRPYQPPPQPFVPGAAQTPDPSQPSAVTRTTAGGGTRPKSDRGKLVLAIVIGTVVGAMAFAAALIVRARMETRTPVSAATTTLPVMSNAPELEAPIPSVQPSTQAIVPSAMPTPSATSSSAAHVRRGMGKLDVNIAGSWCTLTIDGASAGVTPLANYDIASGSHTVTCTPSGGTTKRQSVEVNPGETTRVKFSP